MREAYERESAETLRVLEEGWKKEADAREAHDRKVMEKAKQLASGVGTVIRNTVDGLVRGGLGGGLNALKDAVLEQLGATFVAMGESMVAASPLIKAAAAALINFSSGGTLAAGLALIALGSGMQAAAGSGGGGSGGSYGSAASVGANIGPQMVSTTPYSAPNMTGVTPAKSVTVNATFIGKHDAKAGRELLEMIDFHQRRKT